MTGDGPSGTPPDAPPASAPTAPLSLRTWPRIAAPLLVLVVGVVGAWGTARDDVRDAEQREALVADQTGNLVAATVQQLLAAISGVSGLPDESGGVDRMAFDAYALSAVEASPFTTLAYTIIVPGDERATYESAAGHHISDVPAGGPARPRDLYLPVQWVTPGSDATDRLVGYDLATDPIRLAAIESSRDSGETVVTETIAARPDGDPAVFVVHPVFRPGMPEQATVAQRRAAVVGYVTTSVHGETLLDAIDVQVRDPVAIRIEVGPPEGDGRSAVVLAETEPPPQGAAVVERDVVGQRWRVTVDDRQPLTSAGPWWILAGSAALALVLGILGWRVVRHERDVDLHVATVEGIATLGRSLAAAGSVDELIDVVETEVPLVLGARAARFREAHGTTARQAWPDDDVIVSRAVTQDEGDIAATLEVAWSLDSEPHDLTQASMATVAEMCGQALVRARLTDRVRRGAVTSGLLARLAEASTTAGTTEQVALTLVEGVAEVPSAVTSHIGLLSDDGGSLVVLGQGLGMPTGRHDIVPLDHPWPMAEAFRRGEPVLVPNLEDVAARFPGLEPDLRAVGLAAVAALPLVDGKGKPFGALGMGWCDPQRFDAELVDVLQTTADLCASSLDRARATDRAQVRSTALATLAAHLSSSSSFEAVGATIADHATTVLGADLTAVGVVEGDLLHLLTPPGSPLDVMATTPAPESGIHAVLDEGSVATRALAEGKVVTFSSLDAVSDPTLVGGLARAGMGAGTCAPLLGGDGEVTGVFVALWADPPDFDDALLARIETVADLCAQSTERSQLFDAEHQVRRDLQHTVLVRTPTTPGLEVATRYRPAAQSVGMGGDWYDAIALERGRLCLIVGDVSGHGLAAIAEMTQVRTVVHTLVAGGMPLPEVLVRTSVAMQRDGLGYATVLVAVIDAAGATIRYVTAGHPPPLIRRPSGAVDTLTDGRHSVLGIDLSPKPTGYAAFPVGSTLVMYTDGLVERRGTDIDASVAGLATDLGAATWGSADDLADELLVRTAAAGSTDDDVALVVARRVP